MNPSSGYAMNRKDVGMTMRRARNRCHCLLLLYTLMGGWGIHAAETEETNSNDGAAVEPSAFVLTTDHQILAGDMECFRDGWFILRTDTKRLEISPAHVLAVFHNRETAARARADKTFLQHHMDLPRATDHNPPPKEKPPLPDRPSEDPTPPPSKDPRPKPEAASKKEQAYFAHAIPAGLLMEAVYYNQRLKEAKDIANDYAEHGGLDTLHERIQALSKDLNAVKTNPRTMLEPRLYRRQLLVMFLSHEAIKLLHEKIRSERNPRLLKALEVIRNNFADFFLKQKQAVQESNLSQLERQKADKRLDEVRSQLGLRAPGGRYRRRPPPDRR